MDYREFIQLDLPVAVAIVSCGADWRVEEANAEFTDVLGYTEKELRETRPQKWYMTKIMQIWSVYWKMLSGHMTTENAASYRTPRWENPVGGGAVQCSGTLRCKTICGFIFMGY